MVLTLTIEENEEKINIVNFEKLESSLGSNPI